MLGNWWIQQGVPSTKLARWAILCDEGDAKEIYF